MLALFALALALPSAALPGAAGPFAPSNLRFEGDPSRLARTDDCFACHPAEGHSWQASAHAHASLDNPWYLASFLAVRENGGPVAVRHCGGCHDPALLVSDRLDAQPGDPLTDVGVPCLGCHGVVNARPDGNASIDIDLRDLPDPSRQTAAHRKRMLPELLRSGETCQGCHRGVLVPEMGAAHVLTGFDDWGAWQGSGWAGPQTARHEPEGRQTCVSCHGHDMVGGRTAITAQTGALPHARETLRRAARLSLPAARIDGVWVPLTDDFAPRPGAEVVLELVVRNVGAGHRFPGGLADTQQTWAQVSLQGEHDHWVLDGPHLRALPLRADGGSERLHRPHLVVGAAFDHTVPPGEAQVLRVAFEAPGGPLRVSARLLHRSHRPELDAAACAVTSEHTLDGCAEPPVTEIARVSAVDADAWYALALGRSRGPSESLSEALDALATAESMGLDPRRAAVLEARILGRQGRTAEALASLAPLGDPALGDHASVHATRARAYDAVWRWAEAAEAWRATTVWNPLSVDAWVGLARAEGALGHAEASLEAALAGLALAPRHPELLRSQALALDALQAPDAPEAMAAWLAHRPPDELLDLRLSCDRTDPECDERSPIPTTWLTLE